jgi:hypothetical protein
MLATGRKQDARRSMIATVPLRPAGGTGVGIGSWMRAGLRAREARLRERRRGCARRRVRAQRCESRLDLAAGAVQLSRLFVPLVGSVVAVEPAAPMRCVLAHRLPSVEVLEGRAERIRLPDEFVAAAVIGRSVMQRQRPCPAGRSGAEAATALGTTAVGLAPFLLMARDITTSATATTLVRQLRVAAWAVGAGTAAELAPGRLRE